MTFFTIRAQVVFVRVFMAAVTINERHSCKPLECLAVFRFLFMTLDACDRLMPSLKSKVGFRVVKIGRGCKSSRGMTLRTIIRQGFLMAIRVAGRTALAKSQIRIGPLFQTLVADKVRFMAVAAIDRFMLARQFVAGCTMIEFILVKTHNIEIPAMVVAVAGDAFFSFRLSGCVESHTPVNP